MKLTSTILLVFATGILPGQNIREKELKTEIREVTVFLSGAQIFESGTVVAPAGVTILRIKNLSPYIDERSIQVKGDGNFTILSVNRKFNFLNELRRDEKTDSLKLLFESIQAANLKENARLTVLKEKQSLLTENRNLGGQTSGVTMAQLKVAMEFYEEELSKIKEAEIRSSNAINSRLQEQNRLEQQIKELGQQPVLPSSEIEIRISAIAQENIRIALSYLVENAGWFPKYDVRVSDIKSPLELTYKAEVFQNTGVDWKNVKLRFSNGDPIQSGMAPELNMWKLTYAQFTISDRAPGLSIRNVQGTVVDDAGNPIPGVNIVVKGTTLGTVSDVNGRYALTLPNGSSTLAFSFIGFLADERAVTAHDMNVMLHPDVSKLSEVVTIGYGHTSSLSGKVAGVHIARQKASTEMVTAMVENQTTVYFEVAVPYSIKSNGDKLQVDLQKHEIPALYEYHAIPKLDRDAFLVAQVIDWDQYKLLEGEANLYFEDAYVGRTVLEAKSLRDTLTISLGRDKSIVIGREKDQQYTRRRTIGSNAVDTRGFTIITRNKKSQSVDLVIVDQLPVSVLSDITVQPIDLAGGQLDAKTGKVTWRIKLDPQQRKDLTLQYEVKYPRRERVILE